MRLHTALESLGLEGKWLAGRKAYFTREEFLELMGQLIERDTEIRGEQLDVETRELRIREGAVRAVLAMDAAGLLSKKGKELVREWKRGSAEGLFPDLELETTTIVPPPELER